MLRIDTDQIKKYEHDLKEFAFRAYPFATRNTLNRAAFDAQNNSKNIVSDKMVLRNRFMLQSIRVVKARTLRVSDQESITGSIAKGLEDQEFGATIRRKGKEGIAIPTSYSAGLSEKAIPRTRLPRRQRSLAAIRLKNKKSKGKTKKQRTLLTVRSAVQSGNKFIFLDLGRKKGIFRVVGGRKKAKRGWPKGAKLKMVYDLTEQNVVIRKNPWLGPATDMTIKKMPLFYKESLVFQLKRKGLFKGV